MRTFIIFISACFSMLSCAQESPKNNYNETIKQIEEKTNIVIPNYISIEEETNQAMGDFSKSMLIKFDSINFNTLLLRIKKQIESGTNQKTISLKKENMHTGNWTKYESGYKIESFDSKKNKRINYYVNTNNQTLYYLNVEE